MLKRRKNLFKIGLRIKITDLETLWLDFIKRLKSAAWQENDKRF